MRNHLHWSVVEHPGQRLAQVGIQALVGECGLAGNHLGEIVEPKGIDIAFDEPSRGDGGIELCF